MTSVELRKKFLDFFKKKGHVVIRSSSLLPDDPSVLLTTAGMQQFKKYFTGELNAEKDFGSKNTISIQKCFRTSDIDEVGDETHLTFFEMLGNFSFGGYWKEEAINLAYEFLVKELKLKIDYVSIFSSNKVDKDDWRKEIPDDKESFQIWQKLGIKKIKKEGIDNFWGPTGIEGPCGPTTEIYINNIEVWNLVFNEYYCFADKKLEKLKVFGIDTGMGFERLVKVVQKKSNIFETDLFELILKKLPKGLDVVRCRIVADHLRSSVFLLSDGILPSNKEQGYVLRKLLRRVLTIEHCFKISFENILLIIIKEYGEHYFKLKENEENIKNIYLEEKNKFNKTLSQGLKELSKLNNIDTSCAFKLYESYGLPYEVIKDVAGKKADNLTREEFDIKFKEHQKKSRAGLEKKFGGHGLLLNTGELKAIDKKELEKVKRLHTATHLLQSALRKVLGKENKSSSSSFNSAWVSKEIKQVGSDITADRLRFDFTFHRKITEEEIEKVESLINDIIKKDLEVKCEEMLIEDAKESGALGFAFFSNKKAVENNLEKVKIYLIKDSSGQVFSKEFCGGPHINRTSEIGFLKIKKQESVGAGVRRIRAVLREN